MGETDSKRGINEKRNYNIGRKIRGEEIV